jgi:hypothetical protein
MTLVGPGAQKKCYTDFCFLKNLFLILFEAKSFAWKQDLVSRVLFIIIHLKIQSLKSVIKKRKIHTRERGRKMAKKVSHII